MGVLTRKWLVRMIIILAFIKMFSIQMINGIKQQKHDIYLSRELHNKKTEVKQPNRFDNSPKNSHHSEDIKYEKDVPERKRGQAEKDKRKDFLEADRIIKTTSNYDHDLYTQTDPLPKMSLPTMPSEKSTDAPTWTTQKSPPYSTNKCQVTLSIPMEQYEHICPTWEVASLRKQLIDMKYWQRNSTTREKVLKRQLTREILQRHHLSKQVTTLRQHLRMLQSNMDKLSVTVNNSMEVMYDDDHGGENVTLVASASGQRYMSVHILYGGIAI